MALSDHSFPFFVGQAIIPIIGFNKTNLLSFKLSVSHRFDMSPHIVKVVEWSLGPCSHRVNKCVFHLFLWVVAILNLSYLILYSFMEVSINDFLVGP